ncbi:acryloyl-CoA reductase [Paenibacillus macerans]|uniref:Acryloyl-CoA reductase n=1 Tax=Paenibacillus macerans TaxID=44252 RepID=A0A6N8ETW9_PAEMA|nr:acryloyl-CoA reductase [Paenibacillus macerans]MBS5909917.1 acryloyl-CoA reductase [Paenibacillus macerans]MEC0135948.1 acryloyl-CoA reductase [Paenibacillus macerans]MEC0331019.1 acryloyl-CoA reductase [Paenibacillus macerans]MUG21708.1 acryloyl-CoA reductase [Paenibacillus macerans]UMV46331.1 acryloyl-CoA reductase [Paenibacillus macerans]
MEQQFRAFRVHQDEQGFRAGLETIGLSDLPDAEVTIRVHYSGVNYKDGLASIPDGKIVRKYPFIPGIDLAGEVAESRDARFRPGDLVLCTGYGLGVTHEGGFAEIARVPGDWLVPLPQGLTAQEAMAIGTAGFTAALSVQRLLDNGLAREDGPVLVAGATGGVGSMAVAILAKLGFEVVAVTGKTGVREKLLAFGASDVISREEASSGAKGALGKERWAAIVDPVGGAMTADLLKAVKYGGSVALSGLTAGGNVETTVYPFILRGVNLLGIDSVFCPTPLRLQLWQRLAGEWKPERALNEGINVYPPEQLPQTLETILSGQAVGRQVIVFKD